MSVGAWWLAHVCPREGRQGVAVSLGPEVQDRHAFCPDSFLRVERSPCPTHPLLSLSSQASVSLHWERVTLVFPPAAVPARAGSLASQPFPDQKANGYCSSPRAACCTFHRHAPGDRSDERVPFLKALSTGATALLSQAEGMPRHRGFWSMRVYHTVLRRPAQANRSIPQTGL